MRIVAQGTVLRDRRMFPKIWATLFGVAVVTQLVDGVACQQIISH